MTEARAKAAMLGSPIDLSADQALLGVLRATAGHVAYLATEVANLEALGSERARITVALYADERDRLARVAKACIDAGISRREVEVAQKATEFVAGFIERVLSHLDLTPEQRLQVGPAIREEMAAGKTDEQTLEAA